MTLLRILFSVTCLFLCLSARADGFEPAPAGAPGHHERAKHVTHHHKPHRHHRRHRHPRPSKLQLHIQELDLRAANGDSSAQYELGIRYLKGRGVPKDYTVALAWLRKSAAQNYADAQYSLAGLYDEGRGVSQDYHIAAEWNRKAAAQGHAGAQYNLGMMYATGAGLPPNVIYAHMWFNLSASQGNAAALRAKLQTERRMHPWQLNEAQALAREWQYAHQVNLVGMR